MGWFDEQIKERIHNDDRMVQDSFEKIASAITERRIAIVYDTDRMHAQEAIGHILMHYHIKSRDLPDSVNKLNDVLEYLMRPSGIMRRTVKLSEGWYEDAAGAMLAVTSDGKPVALIPGKVSGYVYFDPDSDQRIHINKKNQHLFGEEAVCFYRPMPVRKMNTLDFAKYVLGVVNYGDLAILLLCSLGVMLLGLFTPVITQFIYSKVVVSGNRLLLLSTITTLLLTGLSAALIGVFKESLIENLKMRANVTTQAATMMRILSVPTDFFRKYSSGDLAVRAQQMETLSDTLFDIIFTIAMTALFSLAYIGQIFAFAPSLCWPALGIILATTAVTILTAYLNMKATDQLMPVVSRESGMVYSLIGGVPKIKNAGAEKRAFSKWAYEYSKSARLRYSNYRMVRLRTTISSAITLFGTLALYEIAISQKISVANYMAFASAYGMVSGAFAALAAGAESIANVGSIVKMASPILEAVPELSEDKPVLERITGGIELSNVSFRYAADMPNVLDNMSLKIRPGQYVAIVGRTGCGKSTLLRILLGFEKPQKGAVYYDGKDMNTVDIKSLRRKIGVVTQNGKLFMGDIYSNIVISKPDLTLDDAWEAAEMCGMKEDIENMPMGMQTLIAEGSGGISGGQRQRLMIARAIAPKPRILMFDEATSALDNITQKTVSESLDKLKCTRIVIAHRLSTIKNCDRIIVLDGGHIVEDGRYDELIAKKGFFCDLVERQRVDIGENKEENSSAQE